MAKELLISRVSELCNKNRIVYIIIVVSVKKAGLLEISESTAEFGTFIKDET